MPQYDINNNSYVERNNNLFDVFQQSDENGVLWNTRYNKDAWGRPKTVTDYSLFSATWSFSVPARLWEESSVNGVDIANPLYTPQSAFTKVTSREHMLSVKSGTVVDSGYAVRSKRFPKYQPNRGHLMSTAAIMANANALGVRSFGLSCDHDGIYFQLEGTGTDWDIFAVRRLDGKLLDKISVKSQLPEDFNPGLGHVYDIQYQWRGVGNYYFYIDLKLVAEFNLLGKLSTLSIHDPARPIEYCSICKEAGTEVEINSGCVDISSEGGTQDRNIFSEIDTGDGLLNMGTANTDTAVIAMRVPRYLTYNGQPHNNSRGVITDKLVTWTRDEALTKAFIFRDLTAPNIEGLPWLSVPDSPFNYLVGGDTSALNTAFGLDNANGQKIINEWADVDLKNIISNPGKNSDFYLTPGDILIITVAPITTNVKSSASLYMSEEL